MLGGLFYKRTSAFKATLEKGVGMEVHFNPSVKSWDGSVREAGLRCSSNHPHTMLAREVSWWSTLYDGTLCVTTLGVNVLAEALRYADGNDACFLTMPHSLCVLQSWGSFVRC